jgi:hypothetical protein
MYALNKIWEFLSDVSMSMHNEFIGNDFYADDEVADDPSFINACIKITDVSKDELMRNRCHLVDISSSYYVIRGSPESIGRLEKSYTVIRDAVISTVTSPTGDPNRGFINDILMKTVVNPPTIKKVQAVVTLHHIYTIEDLERTLNDFDCIMVGRLSDKFIIKGPVDKMETLRTHRILSDYELDDEINLV